MHFKQKNHFFLIVKKITLFITKTLNLVYISKGNYDFYFFSFKLSYNKDSEINRI